MHTVATEAELRPAQRDVLAAAAANRGFVAIATQSDTRGRAVRAGKVKLFDPDNADYARDCCDAVGELIELLLLRESGTRNQFQLTNFGWEQSRGLAGSASQSPQPATPSVAAPQPDAAAAVGQATQFVATAEASAPVAPLSVAPELSAPVATMALGAEASAPPIAAPIPAPELPPEAPPERTIPQPAEAFEAPAPEPAPERTIPQQGEAREAPVESPAPVAPPAPAPVEARPHAAEPEADGALLAALGLSDGFQPEEPRTLEETGLSATAIDDLVLKVLLNQGAQSGRDLSNHICLPLGVLEDRYDQMRRRQLLTPSGSTVLGDNVYELTEKGRERARVAAAECAYAGPAPVPLEDYVDSVNAQSIKNEKPKKPDLERAFSDINVEPEMLARLGPAISAGKGMFVYGPPGNGKTTVAQRITRCFGQSILVPHAIVEDGQIIKFYDASCHEAIESTASELLLNSDTDRRWLRIKRPTVVVGGELTMDNLELKHDPVSHVSEASLQLKSNCGSLLIDDFGRQRVNPTELLNRWIIPLENRIDFLTLANGKKVEVPFEQLIIFSTNLEPCDLADDAFLRRIPFKIEVGAPSHEEFVKLFGMFAKKLKVECPPESIDYLLATHYAPIDRPYRRCQARDLLDQVAHYCDYNEFPRIANHGTFDHAVKNYFTAMAGTE